MERRWYSCDFGYFTIPFDPQLAASNPPEIEAIDAPYVYPTETDGELWEAFQKMQRAWLAGCTPEMIKFLNDERSHNGLPALEGADL